MGGAPIVVVGSGIAGYGVAREFRTLDSERPLVIHMAWRRAASTARGALTGFALVGAATARKQALARQLPPVHG